MHERPAERPIRITSRDIDDALVLRVAGRIGLGTASELRDAIAASLEQVSRGPIIIDLGGVTFLGSVGLAVLADLATEAARRGRPLRVVVSSNHLAKVPIELTGLDDLLALYPTVQDALDADRGPSGVD
ncbi:STAS domain-containing protein [Actinophytocola sp.]|uniref:STAS domain-containing protein n=1 Tax=Actinophytocola sp. TaxID=1872138 RepID=UPI002D80E7EF|nr:STAS domain-containing protein [Actinophytocola sp.]HET9138851.1 STAS domain-containing protein [Actinophytocola sp.]